MFKNESNVTQEQIDSFLQKIVNEKNISSSRSVNSRRVIPTNNLHEEEESQNTNNLFKTPQKQEFANILNNNQRGSDADNSLQMLAMREKLSNFAEEGRSSNRSIPRRRGLFDTMKSEDVPTGDKVMNEINE